MSECKGELEVVDCSGEDDCCADDVERRESSWASCIPAV